MPVDHRTAESGYTFVELAIATAVLAAVVAIAVPMYRGYAERAAMQRAIAELRVLQAAIDRNIAEFSRVPDTITHLPESKQLDPWGRPYQYLNVSGSAPKTNSGKRRKDRNLVPINSDYDLYSSGPDGASQPALTAAASQDDVVRANDGAYLGPASEY